MAKKSNRLRKLHRWFLRILVGGAVASTASILINRYRKKNPNSDVENPVDLDQEE